MTDSSSKGMSRNTLAALSILESFDAGHASQSLSEISRRLSIPKATALRILRAMEAERFVEHSKQTKLYSLAPKILTLADSYWANHRPLQQQRQMLAALSREIGETAHISVLSGSNVVYIEIVKGPQQVSAFLEQYESIPAYCTASGKAILAHSDPLTVEAALDRGMPKLTSSTITARETFLAELQSARGLGYAVSSGEWVEDVVALSMPLFAAQKEVVGALGVAWPKSRGATTRIEEVALIVKRYADELNRA